MKLGTSSQIGPAVHVLDLECSGANSDGRTESSKAISPAIICLLLFKVWDLFAHRVNSCLPALEDRPVDLTGVLGEALNEGDRELI